MGGDAAEIGMWSGHIFVRDCMCVRVYGRGREKIMYPPWFYTFAFLLLLLLLFCFSPPCDDDLFVRVVSCRVSFDFLNRTSSGFLL